MSGTCSVAVEAGVDAVWEVVRDVTRVGEWSHECVEARWIGGATEATRGARFQGRNRQSSFRWTRVCEIVSADPYELVWRTVPTMRYRDSSEWRIRVDRRGDGAVIEQSFTVIRGSKLLAFTLGLLVPAHRNRTAALTDDLVRLGALARKHTDRVEH